MRSQKTMSNTFENLEDQKLATLATSTLARTGAKQAAALRDTTGRTYVAINIAAHSLTLDAVQAVFTVAAASQIAGIESVVIAGEKAALTAVITDNSPQATIFHIDANGDVTRA
jgi:DICT domain-containing protein